MFRRHSTSDLMSPLVRRSLRWLLALTAVLEVWAGVLLTAERPPDLLHCFTGVVLTMTGLCLAVAVLADAAAFVALLHVLTATYDLILVVLILTSVFTSRGNTFHLAIYFASLCFFILQSILMSHFVSLALSDSRRVYDVI